MCRHVNLKSYPIDGAGHAWDIAQLAKKMATQSAVADDYKILRGYGFSQNCTHQNIVMPYLSSIRKHLIDMNRSRELTDFESAFLLGESKDAQPPLVPANIEGYQQASNAKA